VEPSGLSAPMGLPRPPSTPSLIGAIDLFEKDNLLTCAQFLNRQVDSMATR
jgi:hypothetical protein